MMGKEVHDDARSTEGDELTVVTFRRSRVDAGARDVPGLSARRPYAVVLADPNGAAGDSSPVGVVRRIRTTQRAGGAERNLSGAIEKSAGTSDHGERFVSVFPSAFSTASAGRRP